MQKMTKTIRNWLQQARELHSTHLLVVDDGGILYPVFSLPAEDIEEQVKAWQSPYIRPRYVVEIYDLEQDWEAQLAQERTWSIGSVPPLLLPFEWGTKEAV